LSVLRTKDDFRERTARANIGMAKRLLKPPDGNVRVAGDEL
jgi:hypothetical protein